MAGAVVTVTLEQLTSDLSRQADEIGNFLASEAANNTKKKICIVSIAGVKEYFAQSRSPEGAAWAALKMRSGKPLLDQGLLSAANTAQVTGDGVELHNNRIQARIMQEGGVIRPKGKYLAIPLTAEARRAGSPRNMLSLHFLRKKGANKGALADKSGKLQFALVPSVTIPARPFLGFSGKTLDKIGRIIVDDVVKALGAG